MFSRNIGISTGSDPAASRPAGDPALSISRKFTRRGAAVSTICNTEICNAPGVSATVRLFHLACSFFLWGVSATMGGNSISIFWILIFIPRLDAVTAMTEGLQVTLVPEQLRVTAVCHDMIHVSSFHVPSLFRHSTQNMCSGWLRYRFLAFLQRLSYPRPAAGLASSECSALCLSQYFCPGGTKAGQPGCQHV